MFLQITEIINENLAVAKEVGDVPTTKYLRTVYCRNPGFMEVGSVYPFFPKHRFWREYNNDIPVQAFFDQPRYDSLIQYR